MYWSAETYKCHFWYRVSIVCPQIQISFLLIIFHQGCNFFKKISYRLELYYGIASFCKSILWREPKIVVSFLFFLSKIIQSAKNVPEIVNISYVVSDLTIHCIYKIPKYVGFSFVSRVYWAARYSIG